MLLSCILKITKNVFTWGLVNGCCYTCVLCFRFDDVLFLLFYSVVVIIIIVVLDCSSCIYAYYRRQYFRMDEMKSSLCNVSILCKFYSHGTMSFQSCFQKQTNKICVKKEHCCKLCQGDKDCDCNEQYKKKEKEKKQKKKKKFWPNSTRWLHCCTFGKGRGWGGRGSGGIG